MISSMDFALLVLRIVFGLIFFGHGAQKLFGWFGGRGIEGTEKMLSKLNVYPTRIWAIIVGLSEALGGLGLAFGFLTPLAAALIIGVMLVAMIKVHWQFGMWNANRGIEFPLINLVLAAFLGLIGPGLLSIDALLNFDLSSGLTFLLALIVVLIGVAIGLASGQLAQMAGESRSGSGQQTS